MRIVGIKIAITQSTILRKQHYITALNAHVA